MFGLVVCLIWVGIFSGYRKSSKTKKDKQLLLWVTIFVVVMVLIGHGAQQSQDFLRKY